MIQRRQTASARPGTGVPDPHREDRRTVLITIAGAVASCIIGVKLLSPVLYTASIAPFYVAAMKQRRYARSLELVIQWVLTLFITLIVIGIFVPARLESSLPAAKGFAGAFRSWLTQPGSAPPFDTPYLLWGMLVVLAGSALSGGFFGLLVLSVVVGAAAYGGLFLLQNGLNVVEIALIAVPLWQIAFVAGAAYLLVPSSLPVLQRLFRIERHHDDVSLLRRFMYTGAALFAAAIVLRLAIAAPWHALTLHWTVF